MIRGMVLWTNVLLISCGGWPCSGQDSATDRLKAFENRQQAARDERTLVSAEAIVQFHEQRRHGYAEVDLKPLDAGTRYRIQLTVRNPTDEPLVFSGFDFNCRCLTLESRIETIPARGSSQIVFLLTTAKRAPHKEVVHQVRFIQTDKRVVAQVDVKYQLSNMFAVTQSQVKLAVPPGQASATAKIPLVITPPLRVEQLELIIAKPLKGLGIEIVDGLDGAVVQVVAPVEVLEDGPIAGSVGVRLRGSDDSDGFYLTVVPGSRFVIAPEILTLTSSPDEAFVIGEAVLKMAPSPNQPSDKLEPTIQAVIGNEVFDVRVERIPSTATFRLHLQCPRSTVVGNGESTSIVWKVTYGEESQAIESQWRLAN